MRELTLATFAAKCMWRNKEDKDGLPFWRDRYIQRRGGDGAKVAYLCYRGHGKLQRQGRRGAHELQILLLFIPKGDLIVLVRRTAVSGNQTVHIGCWVGIDSSDRSRESGLSLMLSFRTRNSVGNSETGYSRKEWRGVGNVGGLAFSR